MVATIQDPGSINPARVLLGMPGWEPGPNMEGIKTFKNGTFLRLLEQEKTIIEEDDLDQRWENLSGEVVDEIIFLSKHTAVSSRAALTIHPIGTQQAFDVFFFSFAPFLCHNGCLLSQFLAIFASS